eukprot:485970-Alexandrium_andersonii.AAC.1
MHTYAHAWTRQLSNQHVCIRIAICHARMRSHRGAGLGVSWPRVSSQLYAHPAHAVPRRPRCKRCALATSVGWSRNFWAGVGSEPDFKSHQSHQSHQKSSESHQGVSAHIVMTFPGK